MEHIIQQITAHFASRLPEAPEHYSIRDMEAQDFPDFLIRRIHIELQRQLNQSVTIPKTDWAHTQSQVVQKAWQQFLNIMHTKVCLPADHANLIIEAAVTDIIKILIQPRKNIPAILFGNRDRLSTSELSERTTLLVVYPHFARVLNAYMKKKGREELSRHRCKEIITQVDKKITSQYEPMQWREMLDPLFILMHASVDADLLSLFFEGRDMPDLAAKFGRIDSKITQAEFVEVFTSEKNEQPLFFTDDMAADTSQNIIESAPNEEDETELIDKKRPDNKKELPEETEEAGDTPEPDIQHPTSNIQKQASGNQKPTSDETASLNDAFINDAETKQQNQELPNTSSQTRQGEDTELQKQNEEDEESPMWKQFIGPEDEEAQRGDVESSNQKQIKSEYTEKPAADRAREEINEKREQELEELLADEESYFIKNLFNESTEAYRESLREIASKDSWKEASTLISRNIFKHNMINIYSEAAVDFTDRLQTYFTEK